MKTIFIPVKKKIDLNISKVNEISKSLPENITIAYSIQYQDLAINIKDILSKKHKINLFTQVLGCSNLKLGKNTQAILLISDGRFHGASLALETKLPVYVFDNNTFFNVSNKEISDFEKKQKAIYMKFISSDNLGIIISLKPGQYNLHKSIDLKKKLRNKGKKCYLFIGNNINRSEFDNFHIDYYINTACPRLDMDLGAININKMLKDSN